MPLCAAAREKGVRAPIAGPKPSKDRFGHFPEGPNCPSARGGGRAFEAGTKVEAENGVQVPVQ
jgi:hypothetical protein